MHVFSTKYAFELEHSTHIFMYNAYVIVLTYIIRALIYKQYVNLYKSTFTHSTHLILYIIRVSFILQHSTHINLFKKQINLKIQNHKLSFNQKLKLSTPLINIYPSAFAFQFLNFSSQLCFQCIFPTGKIWKKSFFNAENFFICMSFFHIN